MQYPDGSAYHGEASNGSKNGWGIEVGKSDEYFGTFKQNERDGFGILKSGDGKILMG